MSLILQIQELSLVFPHKSCFEAFSADIYHGARIAVIGANGAGKSMLIKAIAGLHELCDGAASIIGSVSYVPQTVEDHNELSGGERFNKALTAALAQNPDLLLLDEPTNHLDSANRKTLMRLIRNFHGAIIAASHDAELIDNCFDTLWHIDNGKIRVFKGTYSEYRNLSSKEKESVEHEISRLKLDKKDQHEKLMREQKRAKNAKLSGEKKRANKTILKAKFDMMKSSGEQYTGKQRVSIQSKKDELNARMAELYTPEVLKPRFNLPHQSRGTGTALQIVDGSVGYGSGYVVENINLLLPAGGRMAITGGNGSGKSTLIKAIIGDPQVTRTGEWYLPPKGAIGYLDQHYSNLNGDDTVFESVQAIAPDMTAAELRTHLNDFLFRKNEEINARIKTLSGGEKARLSLAHMALKTPALLILDEVTNNIDLITKEHIAQILNEYPGALLVISHDQRFLEEINIDEFYSVE